MKTISYISESQDYLYKKIKETQKRYFEEREKILYKKIGLLKYLPPKILRKIFTLTSKMEYLEDWVVHIETLKNRITWKEFNLITGLKIKNEN